MSSTNTALFSPFCLSENMRMEGYTYSTPSKTIINSKKPKHKIIIKKMDIRKVNFTDI